MYQCNYFINRTLISNVKMNLQIPKKMDKRTNHNLQNTTHKTKDREARTPLEPGSNVVVFLLINGLRWEVVVHCYDIDVFVYNYCLNFLFIIRDILKLASYTMLVIKVQNDTEYDRMSCDNQCMLSHLILTS
jgi:hypothetical protein